MLLLAKVLRVLMKAAIKLMRKVLRQLCSSEDCRRAILEETKS
jgi:hypothetical protein